MKKEIKDMGYEGFYIWFNGEKKEEYILTPLFLLGDLAQVKKADFRKLRFVAIRNTNSIVDYKFKNKEILKYPFIKFTPTIEKLGLMLIKFLNINFSNFVDAYDNFYYMYGTELLNIYAESFKLQDEYPTEKFFYETLESFHDLVKKQLIDIQKDFRDAVNFVYNLNGNNEYENYSPQSKFIASMIKEKTNLYKYTKNINIINYTYLDKAEDYKNSSFDDVINELSTYDISLLKVSNIYSSNELGNILFTILSQLIQNNEKIRTCQNCGEYFIPNKLNEIYCDFLHKDGTTCRDKGAGQTYKKNLENNRALLEYRRTYNKKFNVISRAKEENKNQLKQDFSEWKKLAQSKVKEYKQGKITEDELYKWMQENK